MADAGRVIAGTARGIRLEAPGAATRPLGDRVKQALFAILEPDLPDARVLDLFAGSGGAGIEALSRGAAHVTFVERNAGAARVIAANLQRTRLAGERATIVNSDVLAWLQRMAPTSSPDATPATAAPPVTPVARPVTLVTPPGATYDVVIVDPPYAEPGQLDASLKSLGPHLAPGAWVVAKHFWRDQPPGKVGLLASERERRFGETALTFYRCQEDR